jgi:hypothetical protein
MAAVSNIDLDELRATLEHTWLKRRLLYRLRTERNEWLRAVATDPLPDILAGIPPQIEETRKLLASIIEGYSPAQLIDQGLLAALPKKARGLIRDAVHKAYLDSEVMQPLVCRLEAALSDFESNAENIACAWFSGVGDEKLTDVLMNLESSAERLRRALLELPREVVLP